MVFLLNTIVVVSFSSRSVFIRRFKVDVLGFVLGFLALLVLSSYFIFYYIEYVYSFYSGIFVYFLIV